MKVYNVLGNEVATLVNRDQQTGWYTVLWDGRDNRGREVASGVYFCRLNVSDFNKTTKMVLVR